MKKNILLILLLVISLPAWADISVNLSADASGITLEDELNVTVSVEGTKGGSDPSFPAMTGFKIVGSGTSTNLQIINGNVNISKQYTYVLIPQTEGTFILGPVSVFVDGKEFKSNELTIKVERPQQGMPPQAQAVPNPRFQQPPGQPQQPTSQDNLPEALGNDKPFFITTEVTNQEPYFNEEIIYKFKFYTSINVGNATLTLPDFKEFLAEELVPEKKYYENIGSRRYVVTEKTISLIPIKTGDITIGETSLRVEVPDTSMGSFFNDPFFNFGHGKTKNVKALPIRVHVNDLPAGAPSSFTNLVGHFEMESDLSPSKLKEGESATLTITLKGRGNIKDGVLPNDLKIGSAKVYADKPVADTVKTEAGLSGKKVFKMALVPGEAGVLTLPPLQLSYFDPEKREYVTLNSKEYSLDVEAGAKENVVSTFNTTSGSPSSAPSSTPLPIFRRVENGVHSFTLSFTLFWVLFLVPPVILFLSLLFKKLLQSGRGKKGYREKRALQNFNADFSKAKKNNSVSELSLALKRYAGSLSGKPGLALSLSEMENVLRTLHISDALVTEVADLLKRLDASLYSGMTTSNDTLFDKTRDMVNKINGEL
ncbi:BatD family protein [bacterium]|nr:BatD family protein [bacterium]